MNPAFTLTRFLLAMLMVACGLAADVIAADDTQTIYIGVGYGGRRIASTDGVNWRHDTQWAEKGGDDDNCLFNIAFGKGRFIAVGGGAKLGRMVVTTDGKTWRELPQQRGRVATIAFGNDRFVAGHSTRFLYSEDGETFKDGGKIDFKGSMHFRKSAFGSGRFVAIGDCDPWGKQGEERPKRISFRTVTLNGQTIEHFTADTPPARAIAHGNGRFVVVGPDGLRESSADGIKWEHRADEAGENLNSVIFDGNKFIAAGGRFAYTSPDGITWKKETHRIPCSVRLCDGSLYLGSSWGGNFFSSTDGIEWKRNIAGPGNAIEAMVKGEVKKQ